MEFWTTLASVMGVWTFCQSLLQTVFPPNWFYAYCYYDITEIDDVNTNEQYNAVGRPALPDQIRRRCERGNRLSLTCGHNSTTITFGLSNNDSLADTCNGVSMVLVDCMEVFSKGIHRAMVPIEGQAESVAGVELVESASSYRMLTQMDVLKFVMKEHENQNEEVKGIMSHHIKDSKQFQAVTDTVFGVTDQATVIDAIKCMRVASLNAVPIVQSSNTIQEDHRQLVNGKNRKVIATFSATDLRGCPISLLGTCLNWKVIDLLWKLSESPSHETAGFKEIVACNTEFTVGEAVEKAVRNGMHRVWVVDDGGLLQGVFSLTDIIRVIRLWMLSQPLRS